MFSLCATRHVAFNYYKLRIIHSLAGDVEVYEAGEMSSGSMSHTFTVACHSSAARQLLEAGDSDRQPIAHRIETRWLNAM